MGTRTAAAPRRRMAGATTAGPTTAAADADGAADAAPPSRAETLLARYLTLLVAERNLSRFTVRNYAADLRHLFAFAHERGDDPLALTRTLFRAYLASLIEAGTAQASIVRRTSTARSFYRWLRMAAETAALGG
jgi:integrase/recombinase XerC